MQESHIIAHWLAKKLGSQQINTHKMNHGGTDRCVSLSSECFTPINCEFHGGIHGGEILFVS